MCNVVFWTNESDNKKFEFQFVNIVFGVCVSLCVHFKMFSSSSTVVHVCASSNEKDPTTRFGSVYYNCLHYIYIFSFSSLYFAFGELIQGYKSNQRTRYTCCDLCGKVYSNGGVSRQKKILLPIYTKSATYIYCYLCPFSSRRPDNFRTYMRTKHQAHQSNLDLLIDPYGFNDVHLSDVLHICYAIAMYKIN